MLIDYDQQKKPLSLMFIPVIIIFPLVVLGVSLQLYIILATLACFTRCLFNLVNLFLKPL